MTCISWGWILLGHLSPPLRQVLILYPVIQKNPSNLQLRYPPPHQDRAYFEVSSGLGLHALYILSPNGLYSCIFRLWDCIHVFSDYGTVLMYFQVMGLYSCIFRLCDCITVFSDYGTVFMYFQIMGLYSDVFLGYGTIFLYFQVMGLGPMFRLIIGLSNTSSNTPSRNLYITFYCDDKLYKVV